MDYGHVGWDHAYRSCVTKTWFIKICYPDGLNDLEEYLDGATGFSLFKTRLVCTCAHVIKDAVENDYLLLGYHQGEENISSRPLQVVWYKPEWDVAFLRLSEGDTPEQNFQASYYYSELFMGHSLLHLGCGGLGADLYKLMVSNDLPTPEFLSRHRQTYEWVEGDSKKDCSPYSLKNSLSPFLPIIEVSGTQCLGGCSGGPFVSLNGDLVGMMLGGNGVVSYALHFTVLLKAYKEYKKTEASKKKRRKRKAWKTILGGKLFRNFVMFRRLSKPSRTKERV